MEEDDSESALIFLDDHIVSRPNKAFVHPIFHENEGDETDD